MLTKDIKQSESYQVFIKYFTFLIPPNKSREPDVALELAKSMSFAKAAEEETTRQVHATHERIMTESNPKPARRRPSVLIASRKSSRSQSLTRGSSKGTGISPGVPNESTVIPATLSEGTSTKPGVLDKEKVTSKAKANVLLDWGSKEESGYSKEKNINNEDTDDEFMRDDVDKEIKDAEVAESRNGDEEINDTAKEYAKKTKESKYFEEDLLGDEEKDDKGDDVDDEGYDHISDTQDADDEDVETESDEDEIYKYKIRMRKDKDVEVTNAEVEESDK
nr:hypothetical protein [Tanacetum cinerariifolium]